MVDSAAATTTYNSVTLASIASGWFVSQRVQQIGVFFDNNVQTTCEPDGFGHLPGPNPGAGLLVFSGYFASGHTKDVKVEVRTWNQIQKKAFTVTATATKSKNAVTRNATIPYGQAQVYSYTLPNLTRQAALAKAQAILADISKHEMRLEGNLPADNLLSTRMLVTVQGTGTPFDQVYYPDSVIRSMSRTEGYSMRLAAKNHSPESTVTL